MVSRHPRLSPTQVEAILEVTRALAAPFDLHTMLEKVAAEAAAVLKAERASVWLLDAECGELVIEVARDLAAYRLPVGTGLAGQCALERAVINVPDCYADPRFDRRVDLQTGYRTRSCLTVPLLDNHHALVGVLQLLNKKKGVFDADDEGLAQAVAAQCALALERARATEDLLAAEALRQEMRLAAAVQRGTLPAAMPSVPGYAMHAVFKPASTTGGDIYDLAVVDQGLLLMLGDATGHGLAPALTVTRMHAMLRMALRLGVDLETAYREVNDALVSDQPDARLVTACMALLDPQRHHLHMLSAGQGPILHFEAATRTCRRHGPNGLPLGALPLAQLRPTVHIDLAPGDWFVMLSDGVFECTGADGAMLGSDAVIAQVNTHADDDPAALAGALVQAVAAHAGPMPQADDITMVLLKRLRAV